MIVLGIMYQQSSPMKMELISNMKFSELYRNAGLWNRIQALLRLHIVADLINLIFDHIPKTGTVLEVGCGIGVVVNYLSLKLPGANFVGLDIDKKKLNIALKTSSEKSNTNFLLQDATLSIPSCTGIILSDFLHHLPYDKHSEYLQSTFNAIEPGGVLLIIEADPASKFAWRFKIGCFLEFILYPFSERANWVYSEKMNGILTSIGFKVECIKKIMLFPRAIYICKKVSLQ